MDEVWGRSPVRLSFVKDESGNITIKDTNNYYPFGMNHLVSGSLGTGVYNPVATPMPQICNP